MNEIKWRKFDGEVGAEMLQLVTEEDRKRYLRIYGLLVGGFHELYLQTKKDEKAGGNETSSQMSYLLFEVTMAYLEKELLRKSIEDPSAVMAMLYFLDNTISMITDGTWRMSIGPDLDFCAFEEVKGEESVEEEE